MPGGLFTYARDAALVLLGTGVGVTLSYAVGRRRQAMQEARPATTFPTPEQAYLLRVALPDQPENDSEWPVLSLEQRGIFVDSDCVTAEKTARATFLGLVHDGYLEKCSGGYRLTEQGHRAALGFYLVYLATVTNSYEIWVVSRRKNHPSEVHISVTEHQDRIFRGEEYRAIIADLVALDLLRFDKGCKYRLTARGIELIISYP